MVKLSSSKLFNVSTVSFTLTFGAPLGDVESTIVPDYAEPLKAYRGWYVKEGQLSSTYMPDKWEENKDYAALCRKDCRTINFRNMEENPPHAQGFCGFYSLKNDDPISIAQAIGVPIIMLVVGEIEIWGKIIEHQLGYRSEFAKIKRIYHTGHTGWSVKEK